MTDDLPETPDAVWLRRFHPASPEAPVLLLLPHAGGSASYFGTLAGELCPRIDARPVQYPGRQDRFLEDYPRSVDELADGIASCVTHLVREGHAVALFGHSFGATVAFEVVRRLEPSTARGLLGVVVSARRAPSDTRCPGIHLLDDDALVAAVQEEGGAGAAVLDNEEMRELVLPMLRADYTVAETYVFRPGFAFPCPVLTVCGEQDHSAQPEDMRVWARHATGPVRHVTLPGGHFYLDTALAALVAEIRGFLGMPGS
ncbi:MAG: hypothetical protein QG622_1683 [Actinomycetota bacterium]|nr:hypothetical protein [Actinomycetota bacterium]